MAPLKEQERMLVKEASRITIAFMGVTIAIEATKDQVLSAFQLPVAVDKHHQCLH